jgi:hypothetical protein
MSLRRGISLGFRTGSRETEINVKPYSQKDFTSPETGA